MTYVLYVTVDNQDTKYNNRSVAVLTTALEEGFVIVSAVTVTDTLHYVVQSKKAASPELMNLATKHD